jgi:hypothetical protein
MRKPLLAVSALVASVLLAACSTAGTATTLRQFVGSVGSQQYVQLHMTGSVTGHVSTSEAQAIRELSIDVHAENPSGGSVTAANQNASVEVLINVGTTAVADIRLVDSALYFKLDLTGLSTVPGMHITPTELAAAQLFLGGRWFEVPRSVVQQFAPPPTRQAVAQSSQIEARVIDALAQYIDTSHSTKTSNGFTESGTIRRLESAFLPLASQIVHRQIAPVAAPGTYALRLSTSGTTVKGVSLSITVPNGSAGTATVTFTMTIEHNAVSVVAPTGATSITPQFLKDLSGG